MEREEKTFRDRDLDEYYRINDAIHLLIARASGNRVMYHLNCNPDISYPKGQTPKRFCFAESDQKNRCDRLQLNRFFCESRKMS